MSKMKHILSSDSTFLYNNLKINSTCSHRYYTAIYHIYEGVDQEVGRRRVTGRIIQTTPKYLIGSLAGSSSESSSLSLSELPSFLASGLAALGAGFYSSLITRILIR